MRLRLPRKGNRALLRPEPESAGSNPENRQERRFIACGRLSRVADKTNPDSYRCDPNQSGGSGAGLSLHSTLGRGGYVSPLLYDTAEFQLSSRAFGIGRSALPPQYGSGAIAPASVATKEVVSQEPVLLYFRIGPRGD